MVIMILNSEGESGGRGLFDPWQIVQHNIRDEPHKVIVNIMMIMIIVLMIMTHYIFSKHLVSPGVRRQRSQSLERARYSFVMIVNMVFILVMFDDDDLIVDLTL